jgi:hypothetical protein
LKPNAPTFKLTIHQTSNGKGVEKQGLRKVITLLALTTLIILVLSLSFNTQLATKAQTNIPTNVSISLDPEQTGVGMQIQINIMITPPPPTPTDIFHLITVTATNPYGNQQILGPFNTFSNGSQIVMFIPSIIGNYKFAANYRGETFNGSNIYSPSSSPNITLRVNPDPTLPFMDHFTVSPVSSQTIGTPFTLTITALDPAGNTVSWYSETPNLICSTGSISPSSCTGGFSNGVWSGSVTVTAVSSGATITANDAMSFTGTSNSFTVNPASTPSTTPAPSSTLSPSPSPTLAPTPLPTLVPTPSPTLIQTPSPTPEPSPSPTESPSPTPTQDQSTPSPTFLPNKTPQPTASATAENMAYSPLIRKLDLTPITLIGSPPLSTAKIIDTAVTATGVIAIASLSTFSVALLSHSDPKTISDLPLPKPVQNILKKYAEKKFEELIKSKNKKSKKKTLITKREIAALTTTIIISGLVLGYVFADGLPKVLNPTIFSEFFLFGLISACIVQIASFLSDVYCSRDSRIQKELKISKMGGIVYFATGFLKFPFASPSTTTTCAATKYEIIEQKKLNAFTAAFKTLMLSLLIFPFALMSISTINGFVIVGSGGLLTILTMLCVSLLPISPLPGKDIWTYKGKLALGPMSLLVLLLLLYYFGYLTFWSYILIGAIATGLLPITIRKLKSERTKTNQASVELWFKR